MVKLNKLHYANIGEDTVSFHKLKTFELLVYILIFNKYCIIKKY